ncbi:hypothetical protein F5890DRAFT_1553440 [Lentinula detonsa]|uniref:Uncharacterized protein n=1 Tax=Lentinula detonsa TaxID=2804962 RepID=A0AA38USG4_9AGAR|nr:hypothetical protein F5890DRAFT_1553440 [Lentinula detonsa]
MLTTHQLQGFNALYLIFIDGGEHILRVASFQWQKGPHDVSVGERLGDQLGDGFWRFFQAHGTRIVVLEFGRIRRGVRDGLWSLGRFWRVWSRDDDNKEYEGDEHEDDEYEDDEHEEDDQDEDYEYDEDVRCNRPSTLTFCGTFIHSSNAGRFTRIFMLSSNILRVFGMPERSRSQCLLEVPQPILHGLAR